MRILSSLCRCAAGSLAQSVAPGASAARPKVVVLAGPTGVGKTSASLELARLMDGEIICAASVTGSGGGGALGNASGGVAYETQLLAVCGACISRVGPIVGAIL